MISASIGIAFASPDATSDQLLRNADLAMYTAKRRRNGRFEVYESDMHAMAVDRLELEGDLRRGLDRHEFIVVYQPIVDRDDHIVGVEALVRWQHPTRGLMAPASFIQVAEDTGLIRQLGRQVLETACREARQWQVNVPGASHLSVSVNLSPRQLHHQEIVDQVREVLRVSGLPAQSLTLEITEGAMIEDTEVAIERLKELKMLGVRLAVDDFGTGYSSLSYLEQFPVDILKIDRSFVAPMATGSSDSSLASAIISLARSLRLAAVAEGVESVEQAKILAEFGCDLAQGYYFSRPVEAERIEELLRAGARAESLRVVGGNATDTHSAGITPAPASRLG